MVTIGGLQLALCADCRLEKIFGILGMRSVARGICPIAALYLLRFTLVSCDFLQQMLVSNNNISRKMSNICVTWHRRSRGR